MLFGMTFFSIFVLDADSLTTGNGLCMDGFDNFTLSTYDTTCSVRCTIRMHFSLT
jgi:hypothetical protein